MPTIKVECSEATLKQLKRLLRDYRKEDKTWTLDLVKAYALRTGTESAIEAMEEDANRS